MPDEMSGVTVTIFFALAIVLNGLIYAVVTMLVLRLKRAAMGLGARNRGN